MLFLEDIFLDVFLLSIDKVKTTTNKTEQRKPNCMFAVSKHYCLESKLPDFNWSEISLKQFLIKGFGTKMMLVEYQ